MFRTEKETEDLLIEETRMIPMPDGSKQPVRLMKGRWDGLPCALSFRPMEELVQMALRQQKRHEGRSFTRCFEDVITEWNLFDAAVIAGEYD